MNNKPPTAINTVPKEPNVLFKAAENKTPSEISNMPIKKYLLYSCISINY